MSLQARILSVEAQMRDLVLEGARHHGTLKLHTSHADGYWTVTVDAHGNTRYDGYAEEARGRWGTAADLQLWELASLIQTLRA